MLQSQVEDGLRVRAVLEFAQFLTDLEPPILQCDVSGHFIPAVSSEPSTPSPVKTLAVSRLDMVDVEVSIKPVLT